MSEFLTTYWPLCLFVVTLLWRESGLLLASLYAGLHFTGWVEACSIVLLANLCFLMIGYLPIVRTKQTATKSITQNVPHTITIDIIGFARLMRVFWLAHIPRDYPLIYMKSLWQSADSHGVPRRHVMLAILLAGALWFSPIGALRLWILGSLVTQGNALVVARYQFSGFALIAIVLGVVIRMVFERARIRLQPPS